MTIPLVLVLFPILLLGILTSFWKINYQIGQSNFLIHIFVSKFFLFDYLCLVNS